MPRFSVVIPCYNSARTLPETIAALKAQTLTDWEAILVDDGSTDGTPALLDALAAEDPRFLVLQQSNAGPSIARNRAAGVARGAILAFLDADDIWLPGKLASVDAALRADLAASAVFGRIAFFRDGETIDATTSTVRPGPAALADFLGENPAGTLSNLSIRRVDFLAAGGFDTTMRHSEDLEFCVRLLVTGRIIVGLDDLHVRYRTSTDGLSADLFAMHDGWRRAMRSAREALQGPLLARAEARHLRYLARRALRTGSPAHVALGLALKGMASAPRAFLADRHRGPLTLLGCLLAPALPVGLRRRLFA